MHKRKDTKNACNLDMLAVRWQKRCVDSQTHHTAYMGTELACVQWVYSDKDSGARADTHTLDATAAY